MTSTYSLTPSGVVGSVSIADGRPRTVSFVNDLNGQVIRRDEADGLTASYQGDPHQVWYRFAGREIAVTSNLEDKTQQSEKTSIADRTAPLSNPSTYSFYGGGYPDGDLSYEQVNSYKQGAAGCRATRCSPRARRSTCRPGSPARRTTRARSSPTIRPRRSATPRRPAPNRPRRTNAACSGKCCSWRLLLPPRLCSPRVSRR